MFTFDFSGFQLKRLKLSQYDFCTGARPIKTKECSCPGSCPWKFDVLKTSIFAVEASGKYLFEVTCCVQ